MTDRNGILDIGIRLSSVGILWASLAFLGAGHEASASSSGEGDANGLVFTKPITISNPGSCIYQMGILKVPRTYVQGRDGRIVLEAEEPTRFVVQDEKYPERTFQSLDPSEAGSRYIAYLKNGWYELEVTQPAKLNLWYRAYFPTIGHWNHIEKLDDGVSLTVSDNNTLNSKDPSLKHWVWRKGKQYEFTPGRHTFVLDWQGGDKLDQLAFLPDGISPVPDQPLSPTFSSAAKVSALTDKVSLQANQTARRFIFDTDPASGKVEAMVSTNNGTSWHPVPQDGSLAGLQGSSLIFKVLFTPTATQAFPIVYNLALEISQQRTGNATDSIPQAMRWSDPAVELIPATWTGIRSQNQGWSLASVSQPDEKGIIWLDASKADRMVLAPRQESWVVDDPGAAGGQAVYQGILNRNLLSFDLQVVRTAMFQPWFRIKLYRTEVFTGKSAKEVYYPFVNYQIDRQGFLCDDFSKLNSFPLETFRKQEWVWVPGSEMALREGYHTFRIRSGLDYTLLDRVALVPAGSSRPEGMGGRSIKCPALEGEITFQSLDWPAVKKLKPIDGEGEKTPGELSFTYSWDQGKHWNRVTESSLRQGEGRGKPLTFRAIVRAGKDGHLPIIRTWKAHFESDHSSAIVLANPEQRILFDADTGCLAGWWSKQAGWVIPPGKLQPLFQFSLGSSINSMNRTKPSPLEFSRPEMTHQKGVSVLLLKYQFLEGKILVTVRVELPDQGLARWDMDVENRCGMDIRNLEFPLLSSLRVGHDPEANSVLAFDNHGGADFPGAPFKIAGSPRMYLSSPLGLSGTYPGGYSMGWLSLYSPGGAFTAQVRDKDGIGTQITFEEDPQALAMRLNFNRRLYIGSGDKGGAHYEMGWHPGDWHRSADYYSAWAHSWMDFSRVNANWAKDADGWIAGPSMATRYITHGLPNVEWLGMSPAYSQHFACSIDAEISSSTFPLINPRYGTVDEIRAAHRESRRHEWYHTYYWNCRGWTDDHADAPFIGPTPRGLLPSNLNLPARGFCERYGVRDSSGKIGGYGFNTRFGNTDSSKTMCAASQGWQDMLVEGIAGNYGKLQGTDGVYSDEAGIVFAECYADNHGHGKQPALWNKGLQTAYKRALDVGRKDNPDLIVSIEGCTDQLMQYADFGLWVWTPYLDGSPFLYTFPEAKLLKGYMNGGGGWFRSNNEYNHAIQLALRGDSIKDRRFFAHRARIKDWMYPGRFMDDVDLSISRPGIVAKWFKRQDDGHRGALVNIQNEGKIANATITVKWPELARVDHAYAYLYDEEELLPVTVQHSDDGIIVSVPNVKASSVLLPATFPLEESIRAFAVWPQTPGADRLVVFMANTAHETQEVILSYTLPDGVTLKDPPSRATIPAGEVAKLEIPMQGLSLMAIRGKVTVDIKNKNTTVAASCVVAPPLYNRDFEIDSIGKKTPDGWGTNTNEWFIHLLQLSSIPFDLNHADGTLDADRPGQGKYSLRLDGSVALLDRWNNLPDAQRRKKPWYFNTAQDLILKPTTRYLVTFMYRKSDDDGLLEVRSTPTGDCYVSMEQAFATQEIKGEKGNRMWQTHSFTFDTRAIGLETSMVFVNKSTHPIWIDGVKVTAMETVKEEEKKLVEQPQPLPVPLNKVAVLIPGQLKN